ncbi:cysteine-rich venom protein-like [Pelobates fuscus]|uniref:cysteine-rich venom protein-like n=1 Tax=Pelobates fuscus TaxID=191477 RepID=UPI002FE45C6A
MLLIAFLCLSTLLQLSVANDEAILPNWPYNRTNVKSRSALPTESTGRPVTIPKENIDKMANVPFSALSTSNADVRKLIIDTHNYLRTLVKPSASNMLKMVWNDAAAQTAARYASQCIAGHSAPNLRTIPNFNCGENIFLSTFKASWDDVLKSFYSEVVDFIYGYGPRLPNIQTGHYTQLTWATSFQVGCAVAQCSNAKYTYNYVCHYCPPGNFNSSIGFPYKAGKACGDCPSSCENGLCTNPCPLQDWFANCKEFYSGQKCDADLDRDCPATCRCSKNQIK